MPNKAAGLLTAPRGSKLRHLESDGDAARSEKLSE